MLKDFKNWHNKKEQIHSKKERPFFHEREVWFCTLGVNVGFEQDGRGENFLRPALVIKKFNNAVFWVLPLTKTLKKGKYYYDFIIKERDESSIVILSQLRLVDAKRLQYKIGNIKEEDFLEIKKRLIKFLD